MVLVESGNPKKQFNSVFLFVVNWDFRKKFTETIGGAINNSELFPGIFGYH